MDRRMRRLLLKAMEGSGSACRRLGLLFIRPKNLAKCRTGFWNPCPVRDLRLARVFLERSIELGDEKGYIIYHRLFSKGKKVLDDPSYQEIYLDYRKAENRNVQKRLREYLRLGTNRQKRMARLFSIQNKTEKS